MSRPREVTLVTGAGGQDGSILTRRAVHAGDEIHGVYRNREQAGFAPSGVVAHVANLDHPGSFAAVIERVKPSRIFHLAGMTSVGKSWEYPAETLRVTGAGAAEVLEAAWKLHAAGAEIRLVQASSAEIFGAPSTMPQTEETPICPVSPYGVAKAAAHQMVQLFRRRGMHASNAILYNHESRWRGGEFVTRKITRGAARIALGLDSHILLGNLDSPRDWGWAPDYVEAIVKIAEHDQADDYIVASGILHTVRDFAQAAFDAAGLGQWEKYVRVDPALFRPADTATLLGNSSKLRSIGWSPTKEFADIVSEMVHADLENLTNEEIQGRE